MLHIDRHLFVASLDEAAALLAADPHSAVLGGCGFLRLGARRIGSEPVLAQVDRVVGIVVENLSAANEINAILHESSGIIIGRMGIPYRERGLSVLSLIVDGTTDEISALTGRLGRVPNTLVKTALTRDLHAVPDQAGKEA